MTLVVRSAGDGGLEYVDQVWKVIPERWREDPLEVVLGRQKLGGGNPLQVDGDARSFRLLGEDLRAILLPALIALVTSSTAIRRDRPGLQQRLGALDVLVSLRMPWLYAGSQIANRSLPMVPLPL